MNAFDRLSYLALHITLPLVSMKNHLRVHEWEFREFSLLKIPRLVSLELGGAEFGESCVERRLNYRHVLSPLRVGAVEDDVTAEADTNDDAKDDVNSE